MKSANDRSGRTQAGNPVKVKHGGALGSDGVIPVQQIAGRSDGGSPVTTIVLLGKTREFWIHPAELTAQVPSTAGNPAATQEVLTIIFMHEFDHMTPAEGGSDLGPHAPPQGGTEGCGGIKRFQSDGQNICTRIAQIEQDAALSAEDKCSRIKALCELLRALQGKVNVGPRLAEAANCPDVDVSDGQIIDGCCPQCCVVGDCSARQEEEL